jgi:NAD-dependent SIR2 family protein deacetylase
MDYVDKTLTCLQCGDSFTFSAAEQELFARKGRKHEPRRCPDCRAARNQWRRGSKVDAAVQALIQS